MYQLDPDVLQRNHHLHLVSDATGETLEALAQAALAQFEGVSVTKHYWPMIRTARQMTRIMDDIQEKPGLVMFTLVDPEIRDALLQRCADLNIPCLSVLDPVIDVLAKHLGAKARAVVGRQHEMNAHYFKRIDALHYTMAHDDGQAAQNLMEADIILVGVSRTSKTPTSIYLANKGFKTANVPFVPNVPMPHELDSPELHCLIVGLTASPDRLMQIRTNRLRSLNENDDTDYVDLDTIKQEILQCRRFCAARSWPVIDVTRRSIEETAAAILNHYQKKFDERDPAGDA